MSEEAPDDNLEAMALAIFNAANGLDGDTIGTMIIDNFRVDPRDGDNGFGDAMIVCRRAAHAAITALVRKVDQRLLDGADRP